MILLSGRPPVLWEESENTGAERGRNVMRVSILASGSKGNAAFIEMDGKRLLVDVGIGIRRLKKGLAEMGVTLDSLDGIFITHEHTDHIKGLAALLRECPRPVYSREKTLAALPRGAIPTECGHEIQERMEMGTLRIETFALSHDAADPVGYSIRGSRQCTVATDLGFVTSAVQTAIEGADVLVLEANHDLAALRRGSYPWPLKQRILSNRGHLSNLDAAWALARMKRRPAQVFLAHLSEENNRPDLARETVCGILRQQGISLADTDIVLASQTETVGFGYN